MNIGDIVNLKEPYGCFETYDDFEIVRLTPEGVVVKYLGTLDYYLNDEKEFYLSYKSIVKKEKKMGRESEFPPYIFNLDFEFELCDLIAVNAATVKDRMIERALLNKDKDLFEYANSGKLDYYGYDGVDDLF